MKSMQVLKLIAFALAGSGLCQADTVFLKNGDEIAGDIVEEGHNAVVIKDGATGALRSVSRANIDIIVYDRKAEVQPAIVAKAEPPPEVKAPKEGEKKEGEGEKKEGEGEKKEGEGEKKEGAPAAKEGEKKEGEPAAKEGEKTAEKGKEGEKKAEGKEGEKKEGAAEEKPKKVNRPELTQDEKDRIEDLMKDMDTNDPDARGKAKEKLEKIGTKVIASLTDGLYHKRTEARAACATLLGQMNARNAVKQLIEVFYAAVPDKGEPATYQVVFLRGVKTALMSTTGESYLNHEMDKPLVQDGLKKYIEWYEKNFDRLPPQIDEPEIEPTDAEYLKKIKEARALKLVKKEWPRPELSVEHALGKTRPFPPGQAERPQDLDYKNAFPVTDREKAGGYIRQDDKKFGEDFFKKKE